MTSLTHLPVSAFWCFLQVLARCASLIAVAPALGSKQVPSQIKVYVALIVSAALTPVAERSLAPAGSPASGQVPASLYGIAAALVAQTMIGLIMGFGASLVLTAFQTAGALMDLQVGFTMAQTFNPMLGDLAAPITQFQYFYALLLFLMANGHHLLLIALAKSFAILPAGALHLAGAAQFSAVSNLLFGALVTALKIAAPTGAVMLAIDLSFALLNKAMPQMNIYYVGMPVKILAGLFVLIVLLPASAYFAGQLFSGQPQMFSDLMHALRHSAG